MRENKLSVLGAGRMGQEILSCLNDDPGHWQLAGLWRRAGSSPVSYAKAGLQSDDLATVLANADIAVDFSLPEATDAVLDAVTAAGVPLVCGVSGLDKPSLDRMAEVARQLPVFYDRNMSIGIALLRQAVADVARILGTESAVTVHDLHHEQKRDAPSGTALMLGEAVAAARGQEFETVMRYSEGRPVAQVEEGEILFEVRREGRHPGTHRVEFRGDAETLSFGHEVSDRRVFALGALRAAKWLLERPPGLYSMRDLTREIR